MPAGTLGAIAAILAPFLTATVILFQATAETLKIIAADPKHLGAEIGFFAVLHTWGQNLQGHPHLHCVVPGGGCHRMASAGYPADRTSSCPSGCSGTCSDACSWRLSIRANYNSLPPWSRSLRQPEVFAGLIARMKACEWVVYAKRPFAGPQQVLEYVGRYTHRVAISNNRLLDIENGQVRFQWKDYRDDGKIKTMTLSADEFIRRFLLHILPNGFQRIRYYGLLGNRYRKEKLAQCRRLLGMSPPSAPTSPSAAEKDYRDRYEELTGNSLHQCPQCQQGRMLVVEILPRPLCNSVPPIDSS
jgi:hypothetical protein